MTPHPRFDAIRAAAIAALGTPTSDGESISGARRIAWGHDAVMMIATPRTIHFVHPRTSGAWWIVDAAANLPTVPLADALAALKGIR